MRGLLFSLLLFELSNCFSQNIDLDTNNLNKAIIHNDSSIWLTANIKKDHRIAGYEKSSINSDKVLILSVFTPDVKDKMEDYKWGAFYQSSGMGDLSLTYLGDKEEFIIVGVRKVGILVDTIFMERKYFEFEESSCND